MAMNVDDLRRRETRRLIPCRLEKMEVDIAAIQDTHQNAMGNGGRGYIFYTTSARK